MEKDNVARKLLKPLYCLSTDGKDCDKNIRNLLANECGGRATSLDKSVFFGPMEFFYEYGVGFRDKNAANLEQAS